MIELARTEDQLVEAAQRHWGLEGGDAQLVAQRENSVWRLTHPRGSFALRLHRPGYRTRAELCSELDWMAYLDRGGLPVPAPLPARDGTLVAELAPGRFASILSWLDGQPIGQLGHLAEGLDPAELSHAVGRQMAKMHDLSDAWVPPPGFSRPDWGRGGLLGEAPLWGQFWTHPDLNDKQQAVLQELRGKVDQLLIGMEDTADQGLIHADILGENVMHLPSGVLAFIDFDDCAHGYRTFELATWLLKFSDRPYAADMRSALLEGYAARREVSADELDLFLLLRALTYVGWIIPRMAEPGGQDRSRRMLDQALRRAKNFVERTSR